jgi:RNA polymerase sigma-70 factor (ECF subfamily)
LSWLGEVLHFHTAMSRESPVQKDFKHLYEMTLAPLRRYLARLLGNNAEAQDIAHDAYLRVYPKMQDQSAESPEALLYTTARNLAFNRLKRRRVAPFVSTAIEPETAASTQPGVVQQAIARQELQHLETAIAGLPAGCRTVLLLRKIELLSHREISERLGIAISTVEKQHARALRLLRHALAEIPESTTAADSNTKEASHE